MDDPPDSLPETVYLPENITINEAWRLFTLLEAVEWKWTITEMLEQPEALLEAVLSIRALAGRIERQKDKRRGR